ncbi:Guided entry of tail-anchored proteins factor 1 [Frankliniella fusca]|uniref:Guided entry of tail-anchored proteins factor 1 n=1 Tax=Frankliniella fusca TaxID=407009 RepID=A0AAE1HR29_9NEOP|nr:Guided entry of tail-anchored proteins factor 1 [Frankliniella fusca]
MYVNTSLFFVITIGTVLSSFSQLIIKYALSYIFRESDRAAEIRKEIVGIRTEMSQISMIDEFARHARLQRKLIKMQDELKGEKMAINGTRLKFKVMISAGATLMTSAFMLLILYLYRSEAVVILPESWLSPFSSIISWPAQETGAVSVLTWVAICGSVSRLLAAKFSDSTGQS